jgi:hypothetical protein
LSFFLEKLKMKTRQHDSKITCPSIL